MTSIGNGEGMILIYIWIYVIIKFILYKHTDMEIGPKVGNTEYLWNFTRFGNNQIEALVNVLFSLNISPRI